MKILAILKEQHLIVVDPGSHCEAIIRKTIETINKTGLCHSSDPHSLMTILWVLTWSEILTEIRPCSRKFEASSSILLLGQPFRFPRHDDMADVIRKPATRFVFHEEYQIEEFRFTVNARPLYRWSFIGFPRWTLILTGDAPFRETIGRTDLRIW